MDTLDALGQKHQTDKASGRHNYLHAYDAQLSAKRMTARTVLEIGVKGGASVRMWRDYFPQARILGIDLNPSCKEQESERITVAIGDQSDSVFLDSVIQSHPLDVVIEDGSHIWKHQISCFQHIWPKLQAGGVYITEDLQTSRQIRYGEPNTETGSAFFARIACAVATGGFAPDEHEDPFVKSIRGTISQIIFGTGYCIAIKRDRSTKQ